MKGGDLDNSIVPRVYVVFEGTLATPRPKKGLSKKLFGLTLNDYDIDPEVTKYLWDIWQRMGVRFDAVTFDFDSDDVQRVIDKTNLPIHTTYEFMSRESFIKQLPFMPWVTSVVDHAAPMAYGGRGISLTAVR